ncbi:hypothetical protein [Stakelama tenebrarum]|uniref:Uncharacterized protein n=1 Tax=Stakelama tenebrarum TaxID=2711215 RepID=A0A6G6Y519_9SPHN|nr:hypothetical protein [Sphingosinithalassobacter tenebrarum]QIG79818.1 hypothetical protein G5C33_08490 [Sphingosinithalassobacter tenebrarum]
MRYRLVGAALGLAMLTASGIAVATVSAGGDPCRDRFDARACPDAQILPHSNSRELMLHEVRGFTPEQLALARDEILVRHGQVTEDPVFTGRNWYAPVGDIALSRLSPVETTNYAFLHELAQSELSPESAQWALAWGNGDWRARVTNSAGATGTLYGSDHRLRYVPDEDGEGWLYLPRDAEVYFFDTKAGWGTIEPDWRAPWLLPADVIDQLDVVMREQRRVPMAGAQAMCTHIQNRDRSAGYRLDGEYCATGDGIPLHWLVRGVHDLEGQEEMLDYQFDIRALSFERGAQSESLFVPPAGIAPWVRPG